LIQEADLLTVASRRLRSLIARIYQLPVKKIKVVPNFVELDYFQKMAGFQERDALIHISNFRRVKRAIEVVKAFEIIKKQTDKNLRLILVGEGPEKPGIINYLQERKIPDVVVHGILDKNEIAKLLNQSLAFVLPSYFENSPLALLEAQACGTPQLATDVGGVKEFLLDKKTGFLLKSKTELAQEIARKFFQLVQKSTWEKMSQASVENAQKYDLNKIAARYKKLFQKII